ncbi:hypothetical protein Anas_13769 [Armadillidium nasatum]|uniref:Uncharacterized protein n=1 Tax=Armadillidium nasatum TaxID=96803 RepID=A0A5N5TBW5_9CRUS|nr:hypothetical protein Anas_13769 [Armadillidium nasatum]
MKPSKERKYIYIYYIIYVCTTVMLFYYVSFWVLVNTICFPHQIILYRFFQSLETSKDVLIGSGMLKEEVEEDKESQEDFKDFEYPTDYLKEGERAHESDDGLSEDVGRKSKCVLTVIIQQYGIVLSKDTY